MFQSACRDWSGEQVEQASLQPGEEGGVGTRRRSYPPRKDPKAGCRGLHDGNEDTLLFYLPKAG